MRMVAAGLRAGSSGTRPDVPTRADRYLLRPPIAHERLALRPDGKILVTLKIPWRDGTTHLCFEPITLLERLATLTPRPRINVVLYHGILASRAKWRPAAVAYRRTEWANISWRGHPSGHADPRASGAPEALSRDIARQSWCAS